MIPYDKRAAKRLRQLQRERAKNRGVPGIVMNLRKPFQKPGRRGFNDSNDPQKLYDLFWPRPPPPKTSS